MCYNRAMIFQREKKMLYIYPLSKLQEELYFKNGFIVYATLETVTLRKQLEEQYNVKILLFLDEYSGDFIPRITISGMVDDERHWFMVDRLIWAVKYALAAWTHMERFSASGVADRYGYELIC